jgi:glucokinase
MELIVGFDLGGTKMNAAAVDKDGKILASARQKTLHEDGPEKVIARMAELVRSLVRELGAQPSDLRAVCVGVPGGVDDRRGIVDKAPNLGWDGVPLRQLLSALLGGAQVFLDNDVRVAVLGEYAYGIGRGTRNMIGIFVGTGIGGGLVVNGELVVGQRGSAGEVGHMVLDPKGPRCSCGRRGCAEAFASRTSIERDVRARIKDGKKSMVLKLMKKEKRPRLTSSVVARALEERDKVMTQVFERAMGYVGMLVGNLVNVLDPEVVVIGGGMAERLGEQMVAPIREVAYEQMLVQRERERVRIVPTELKDMAAPAGAAFIARSRLARA